MTPDAVKNMECIFEKLRNTITAYKELYPELMYLEQELKKSGIGDASTDIQLEHLIAVNYWLKEFIMQYYVFRIISHRLDQDLAILQYDLFKRDQHDLYLEFALA
jgi:hypothetical protein